MSGDDPPSARRSKTDRGIVAVAAVIVLSLIGVGIYAWMQLSDVVMDASGYVAMVAGALATIGLGAGLMALVFYSHRAGYDDKVGGVSRDDPKRDTPD